MSFVSGTFAMLAVSAIVVGLVLATIGTLRALPLLDRWSRKRNLEETKSEPPKAAAASEGTNAAEQQDRTTPEERLSEIQKRWWEVVELGQITDSALSLLVALLGLGLIFAGAAIADHVPQEPNYSTHGRRNETPGSNSGGEIGSDAATRLFMMGVMSQRGAQRLSAPSTADLVALAQPLETAGLATAGTVRDVAHEVADEATKAGFDVGKDLLKHLGERVIDTVFPETDKVASGEHGPATTLQICVPQLLQRQAADHCIDPGPKTSGPTTSDTPSVGHYGTRHKPVHDHLRCPVPATDGA